jgi:leucyl aminopeptidase (aminopeptidase T)
VNERIKKIWEEAAKTTQSDSWEELTKFMERFAELIVRECADVANQHMEHNEGTDYNVGGKIKEHFGVEE